MEFSTCRDRDRDRDRDLTEGQYRQDKNLVSIWSFSLYLTVESLGSRSQSVLTWKNYTILIGFYHHVKKKSLISSKIKISQPTPQLKHVKTRQKSRLWIVLVDTKPWHFLSWLSIPNIDKVKINLGIDCYQLLGPLFESSKPIKNC